MFMTIYDLWISAKIYLFKFFEASMLKNHQVHLVDNQIYKWLLIVKILWWFNADQLRNNNWPLIIQLKQ